MIDKGNLTQVWRDRIEEASIDRQQFEPTWFSNLAFVAGKHWLEWNPASRQLQMPIDIGERELYTVDMITERRMTALGELSNDEDRPQLLLVSEGGNPDVEGMQEQLNRAVQHGWDHEWHGDQALAEVRRICMDLGTAAVRVRFDPMAGPPEVDGDGEPLMVPYHEGRALLDTGEATEHVASMFEQGGKVDLRAAHKGQIRWEALSPFNLLVPPGVDHEKDFPWEIVARPVPLDVIRAQYPDARDLAEDSDISSVFGMTGDTSGGSPDPTRPGQRSKLRGHSWLYTCFERPTPAAPLGRTIVLGGANGTTLLDVTEKLPCRLPDGTPSSGIAYFHWWRVTGRFWSRSMVEALKDPQRMINRRKTQNAEIIDRGMPKVFLEEGSLPHAPKGHVLEIIELAPGKGKPEFSGGIGPGEWMYRDIEEARVDLEHASGMRGPSMGDNPENVSTYSQLALLAEKDQVKRSPMLREHRTSIGRAVEASVHYIRKYWGEQKQLLIADDDDKIDAVMLNANQLPEFFVVKLAKGAPKPRSQAAEIKKIEDIARYSTETGMPLPVDWLYDSLEAGQALEIPSKPGDDHGEKAEVENVWMGRGQPMPVMDYDPPEVHLPIHRQAQIQADIEGDLETWQLLEQHVLEHQQVAMMQALQAQQIEGPPPIADPTEQQQPAQAAA